MKNQIRKSVLKTGGFTLLSVLLFGIVLLLMISSGERGYAYLILAACIGGLVFVRRSAFWHGWRVPLCWVVALAVAWTGLFAGQPLPVIGTYTGLRLEQPSASYELLLNNVTIVDTRTGGLTSGMSILCAGGVIRAIGPTGTLEAGENTKVVDAAGKYAVPGYLNMHMHVIGDKHTDETMESLLANGITGFRQMSGSYELLKEWHSGAFTHSVDRAALITMPGDVLTPINAPTPSVAAEFVRLQKQAGADFIKVGGVTPEVLQAIQAEADRLNLPVAGHVLSDMDLKEAARQGFKSVEHFGINNGSLISSSTDEERLRAQAKSVPAITGNPVFVQLMKIKGLRDFVNAKVLETAIKTSGGKEEEAELMHIINTYSGEKAKELADVYVQYNTWQSPTMIRMRSGLFSNGSEATAQGLYDLYLKLVKTYDTEGVKLLAGTDGGSGDSWQVAGYSLHEEFDELERAGIPPLHVLQMATLNGAEFLDRMDDMGTVDIGKIADMVLLDANPIESVQNLHKINAVIRAGAYHDNQMLSSIKQRLGTI
ncbi:amidohydrolase family protein [Paenibacillus sp. FSL H3-0469]|uniref:amidohydrolase family protein n=1 Tax=Paenibacillus sp. FSL H3-0469 TaxID=2954506 RepID=UPI0031012FD7